MARGKYGETLQAVEINASSFIGTASNEGGAGSQVHMAADGDITFSFPSGDQTLSGLKAGMDLVAGPGCTGITSTALVIIS